jgi:hypothetical protein
MISSWRARLLRISTPTFSIFLFVAFASAMSVCISPQGITAAAGLPSVGNNVSTVGEAHISAIDGLTHHNVVIFNVDDGLAKHIADWIVGSYIKRHLDAEMEI